MKKNKFNIGDDVVHKNENCVVVEVFIDDTNKHIHYRYYVYKKGEVWSVPERSLMLVKSGANKINRLQGGFYQISKIENLNENNKEKDDNEGTRN